MFPAHIITKAITGQRHSHVCKLEHHTSFSFEETSVAKELKNIAMALMLTQPKT